MVAVRGSVALAEPPQPPPPTPPITGAQAFISAEFKQRRPPLDDSGPHQRLGNDSAHSPARAARSEHRLSRRLPPLVGTRYQKYRNRLRRRDVSPQPRPPVSRPPAYRSSCHSGPAFCRNKLNEAMAPPSLHACFFKRKFNIPHSIGLHVKVG